MTLELTDFQKGYLAAMIDRPGSVQFGAELGTSNKWKVKTSIQICGRNALLNRIREFLPKSFMRYTQAAPKRRSGNGTLAIVRHDAVYEILEAVLPYLLIVRPRAEIVLRFVKSRLSGLKTEPYSANEIAMIAEYDEVFEQEEAARTSRRAAHLRQKRRKLTEVFNV